ncbi:helix-turn-helix transcriptional regulator [bacterium]|nr:helix-turn-helix transcriptional regulator [bacterium]MDY3021604.1 helix-turn-helix transcriptional regulator [Oliverpabstia sp.]
MDKNRFLIINDIIYELYNCKTMEELQKNFLRRLKLLIPYSYASILLTDKKDTEKIRLTSPICYPESFVEAENEYLKQADEDHLLWILHSRESTLIRESDLIGEESRLNTPLYLHCYRKYNIFDSLQFTIVHQQNLLGVLSLFRTKIDDEFSDADMFYLRSLGMHLNAVLYKITTESVNKESKHATIEELQKQYGLTVREAQILGLIFLFLNNEEIVEKLDIKENTLQKHMQNIFRKMNASSKWDLLRFRP